MGDVNAVVKDGNLGRNTVETGTGIQVKIGVSPVTAESPIQITGTMEPDTVREKLGNSPLADACICSMEWGAANILAIPVAATTAGTVGQVTSTKTGAGTFAIQGSPNNAFDIVVEITEAGENNEAEFKYSLNGGESYVEDIVIPTNGSYAVPLTGLTLKFTEANDGDSWKAGDKFVASATAPAASNADLLAACRKLFNYAGAFEFVHIVGTTTGAFWASLASLSDQFATTYKRPTMFIAEARNAAANETVEAYVAAMETEKRSVSNFRIQAVCSWSEYVREDGAAVPMNNASIAAGLYCRAKESQSIGEVRSFTISEGKINKLLPAGIEDYIGRLDAAKYLTLRRYIGRDGYYVTNARMMCPEGSDYAYAEDTRVSNRLVKEVRNYALNEMQIEIDPGNIEAEVAKIEEYLNIPIERAAEADKIISSGRLTIDRDNLIILVDEELTAVVTYVPMGHVRNISLEFKVENPYSSAS